MKGVIYIGSDSEKIIAASGSAFYASGLAISNEAEVTYASGLAITNEGRVNYASGQATSLNTASGVATYASGQAIANKGDLVAVSGIAAYASGLAITNEGRVNYASGLVVTNEGRVNYASGLVVTNESNIAAVSGAAYNIFNITAGDGNVYTIDGMGLNSASNPTLHMHKGHTYILNKTFSGHPFKVSAEDGGDAYTDADSNAIETTSAVESVTFEVPQNAPDKLYYYCTSHPSNMKGVIYTTVNYDHISYVSGVALTAQSDASSALNRANYASGVAITNENDLVGVSGISAYASGLAITNEAEVTYASGLAITNEGRVNYASGLAITNEGRVNYASGLAITNEAEVTYASGLAITNEGRVNYASGLAITNEAEVTYASGLAITNELNVAYASGQAIENEGDLVAVSGIAAYASGVSLTVKEADGSPNVSNVRTIVVSNGTLTDDGAGQVTVTTGGGGGSSLTAGSGIIVDGADRINIHGGTGNLQEIQVTSNNIFTPKMVFTGSGVQDTPVTMKVLSSHAAVNTSGTALSFEGTQGQLFGITDNLSSGNIFSVADITGLPLISADASGDVKLGEYGRFVGVGTGVPLFGLDVSSSGQFQKGFVLSNYVPATTTNTLYNEGGTLKFNGAATYAPLLTASGAAVYASGQVNVSTDGTAEASKALILDAAKSFTGTKHGVFNEFDSRVTASGVTIGASGITLTGGAYVQEAVPANDTPATEDATITLDLSTGNYHNVILGNNVTKFEFLNAKRGQRFLLRITQHAGSAKTIAWTNVDYTSGGAAATVRWAGGGTAPTMSTSTSHTDVYGFLCTNNAGSAFDGFVIGQDLPD